MNRLQDRLRDNTATGMTFIRYVLIQLLGYVIDMGGYVLCLVLGMSSPVLANVLAKSASGLFTFIAHRHFTFKSGSATDRAHQAVKYFSLLGLNVPFASSLLAALLLWISNPLIAKFLSDVLSVGLSFWLSKRFVFVSRQQPPNNSLDRMMK